MRAANDGPILEKLKGLHGQGRHHFHRRLKNIDPAASTGFVPFTQIFFDAGGRGTPARIIVRRTSPTIK
jgi:hypothetical protein